MVKSSQSFTHQGVATLIAQSQTASALEEHQAILHKLVDLYEACAEKDAQLAQEIRHAFLLALEGHSAILEEEKLLRFLTEQVRADDFATLLWKAPDPVVSFSETMYGFRCQEEAMAEKITAHVHALLRHALYHFEQRGDYEHMFRLLQMAPISPVVSGPELHRLRNRAYRYEMRRVGRRRRLLYGYLLLQVLLMVSVFPFLFINAENGVMQAKIEAMAQTDLPEDARHQYLSYVDGLYWSLITASSIGYGDITPVTRMGKIIAATLGIMGVITVGVIAGLILNWISPRRLDWH